MIRYIPHHEIDKDLWDKTVTNAVNGSVYAFSWYLDIVAGTWDALVEGNYENVMPLPWRKKGGISYIHQPRFTQQLGLIGSGLLKTEQTLAFLKAIPGHFRFAEFNLNKQARLGDTDFLRSQHTNFELELINDYTSIRAKYSANLKRNLEKAKSGNLTIHGNLSPEPLINMFRSHRGHRITTLDEQDYQVLKRLIYHLVHNGAGQVRGVYNDRNELCAGMALAETKDRSVFLFSAVNDIGRSLQAMPFLIDQYLQSAAGSNRIFDFEGSDDPGLARFYRGFGARASTYQSVRINRLPIVMRPAFALYRRFRP